MQRCSPDEASPKQGQRYIDVDADSIDGIKPRVRLTAWKHALEGRAMARAKDDVREQRITMGPSSMVMVPANVRRIGYYLDGKLKVRCRAHDQANKAPDRRLIERESVVLYAVQHEPA